VTTLTITVGYPPIITTVYDASNNPLSGNWVTLDYYGNIYTSDTANNVIRKYNKITGVMSIYAGTGTFGHDPLQDGGPAISANIAIPVGLGFDASGNLYFLESGSVPGYAPCLRVVDSSGIISTPTPPTRGVPPFDALVLSTPTGMTVYIDAVSSQYICICDGNTLYYIQVAAAKFYVQSTAPGGATYYDTVYDPISKDVYVTASNNIVYNNNGGTPFANANGTLNYDPGSGVGLL
jgi:hypothetical protein